MSKHAKPGYYVEGRHYGFNIAQARARAQFLAREFGRPVALTYTDQRGRILEVDVFGNQTREVTA